MGDENHCRVKSYSGGAKRKNRYQAWIIHKRERDKVEWIVEGHHELKLP